MITMILGSQGSGKTACMVREMLLDQTSRTYFSNIITKHVKNNVVIQPEMIVNKKPVMSPSGKQVMKNGVPQFEYHVNKDFWIAASKKYHSLNVIIDEAHSILNARRAMLKHVQPILDWISLLRRVLGSTSSGYGRLYLITQIERRLDIVAKEQATEARFHLCHYRKTCKKCGLTISENNETSDQLDICPNCNIELIKHSHVIEVWHFKDYNDFIMWKYLGKGKRYYKHYYITDIEKVFPFYNTMQWDNLLVNI